MKVAIIGTGFLGEAIYRVLEKRDVDIITTHYTHKKFDASLLYDFLSDDVEKVFPNNDIDVVIVTAMVEFSDDSELLKKSMESFLKFFDHSRILYISSDGIFDGEQGNYTENDKTHPVTLYGRNLKLCEGLVQKYSKNYCIIRPSYMYGFVGQVLDTRLRKVSEEITVGKSVIRFTDMYKSPLSYRQAAEIVDALTFLDYIGTVHISGERMSVYDFTKRSLETLGLPINTLVGNLMPIPRPEGFLPDTSLCHDLMERLTNIKPKSIEESL